MIRVEQLLDTGLVPIEEAARNLGIDVKRLRGYVWRNSLRDPIGDANFVYGWSCRELTRTVTSSAAVPYPKFCHHPDKCAGKGSCQRNPVCCE